MTHSGQESDNIKENLKNLTALLKKHDGHQLVTNEEFRAGVSDMVNALAQYRSATGTINKETKKFLKEAEDTLNLIVKQVNQEHDRILTDVKETSLQSKSDVSEAIKECMSAMKKMCDDIMAMKPKDGETPEMQSIVAEVLKQMPEDKEETAEETRDLLETLQGEERLDVSAIKGVEEFVKSLKLAGSKVIAGGSRLLAYLSDVSITNPANNEVLKYNSTTQRWENGTGGSGAVDSVNGATGVVVLDADDISDTATTNKFATAAEKTKLSNISITQAVDLDALETASHAAVTLAGEDFLSLTGQQITANPIDLDNLSATGTPSGSTFLRGDNTWATPAGSGDVSKVGTPVNNQVGVWTGDGTIEGDAALTFDTASDTLSTGAVAVLGASGAGYASFATQASDPSTPASGTVKLFAADTPGGITRLNMLTSTGATLSFFRDAVTTVRNETGSTISKGKAVYINGANGTTSTVALAQANSASTSADIGLAIANISNNAYGTVQRAGIIRGVDTSAWTAGDTLWLSAATPGALTNVEPVAPNFGMKVGTVILSSASGSIDLFIQPFVASKNYGDFGTLHSTSMTASELTATDASKNLVSLAVATYPSLAEIAHVKGVTSAIQTQLNGKQASMGADDNYVTDAEKVVIGNTSGTNSGDNAVNSNYSGLVSNATHTGDATGSGALTVVALNGTNLAALGTGVLKNTTTTGVPFISKVALTEPATAATLTIADNQTLTVNGSATITNGTHSGTNTGDQTSIVGITGTKAQFNTAVTDGDIVYSGDALGTPSSGTLTNCTGLPVNGIVDDTTSALGVGSIELGHASDTTITRVGSGGAIAVEGLTVAMHGTAATFSSVTTTGNIELGSTDTTLARVGAGQISVEGVNVVTTSSTDTLTNKTIGAGALTLAENASIALDPAGSADGKYSGITVTGTGGATIAFGDLVTLDKDDSRWELVDISVAAAATGDARGLLGMAVTSSTDGGALTVLLNGIIRADANFPALTIGAEVFASTTGDIVVTQPTTTDYVIRRVGAALTADEIYFNPSYSWYTHV
jgi:hypothetical protein